MKFAIIDRWLGNFRCDGEENSQDVTPTGSVQAMTSPATAGSTLKARLEADVRRYSQCAKDDSMPIEASFQAVHDADKMI